MVLMHIINTLAPVFLIIALGAALKRGNFLSEDFAKGINRLAYWVGLPCLLFYKVTGAEYDFSAAGMTFLVVAASTVSCAIAGYIVSYFMKVPASSCGTFVQGALRGNLAYVGLAIIISSLSGAEAAFASRVESIAVLVVALTVPVYNFLSVIVLLLSRHELNRGIFLRVVRGILTNPLIIACVSGIVYSLFFDSMAPALSRTFAGIGQMALPLALIGIGTSLAKKKEAVDNFRPALGSSLIKVFLAPLTGFLFAKFAGLGAAEMSVVMILLACPTAVASFVLTEEIGGDSPLSAKIVVVSSILSAISLALAVGLF